MRMRGGCICDEATAVVFDANRSADLNMARNLLMNAEVWVEDQAIMFRMVAEDGEEWFGTLGRRDPSWFTKRTPKV